MKMDRSVLEEKSSKIFVAFSSKLDCCTLVIFIAKTAAKKIAVLIRSMKCLSPEVTLYLYKATLRPCMEYCSVLGGDPGYSLESLDKLQKRILVLLVLHFLPLLIPWFIIEM